MNITYIRPGELRKPDIEVLPDGRIRITRYIAAGHGDRDYNEITESVGTHDDGLSTALLVKRTMGMEAGKPAIIKTYEVRDASAETQVGLPDVSYGDNGLKTIVQDFVQMSTGTYAPGTIGTTTCSADATCVLQQEQMQDDGTTRQIRRVFINKGLINQVDDTKNNGALLLKTLVYLNDAPSPNPPTGYTLVTTRVDSPNGLETTTYTFAKGTGQISQDDETKNNGSLLVRTIRYLSVPSVSINPISTPAGYTLISQNYADQDGYRMWSAAYAQGTGQISQDDETKNNGSLYLRTIRYLSTPSVTSNPITTPSGYTLVSQNYASQDGYKVWSASYAQGTGQISQDDETKNNGNLLIRSIRYLSTPSVGSNPITTPTGYTLFSQNYSEQDGYRVWTASYAKGTGQLNLDTRYSQSTDGGTTGVTVYSISYLSVPSVSSNPISTPAGTVLISQNYQDQDGYRLWSAIYAKGTGTINTSTEYREGGKLVIYHKASLGAVPSTPAATIGGSVVLVSSDSRNADGYIVYDYRWAEGYGVVSDQKIERNDGLMEWRRTILTSDTLPVTASSFDTTWRPTTNAVMLSVGSRYADGYTMNDAVWMLSADGVSAPTSATVTVPKTVSFTVPGLAVAANPPSFSPPITRRLSATSYTTYSTSTNTDSPYSIVSYAQFSESFTLLEDLKQYNTITSKDGYVGSSSFTGSNTTYRGLDVTSVATSVYGSNPTSLPSGLTVLDADSEVAFVKYDGTKYYRNTSIKFTF